MSCFTRIAASSDSKNVMVPIFVSWVFFDADNPVSCHFSLISIETLVKMKRSTISRSRNNSRDNLEQKQIKLNLTHRFGQILFL
jgi:hypothetical protein